MDKELKYKLQDIVCNKCRDCKIYQLVKCEGINSNRPFYCPNYTLAYREDSK